MSIYKIDPSNIKHEPKAWERIVEKLQDKGILDEDWEVTAGLDAARYEGDLLGSDGRLMNLIADHWA